MKFIIDSSVKNPHVTEAVTEAAKVWNDPNWRAFVKCLRVFEKSADGGGGGVNGELFIKRVEEFDKLKKQITITAYHTWRGVYGYVTPAEPTVIHLNDKFFGRSVPSIRGTVVHEACHVVDNLFPEIFGHGDNNPGGKQFTLPYFLGNAAIMWDCNAIIYEASDLGPRRFAV